MSTDKIELGDEVKDSITGFKGVVVADTLWLNGCRRILVQPKKLSKDGKPVENSQFDVEQLVLVQKAKRAEPAPPLRKVGGPTPMPSQNALPR